METFKNKDDKLKKIKEEVLKCQKCPLYKDRNYPVIGEGDHQAKIMFIGEAPGAQEDKTGRPFCGAAGKILDELLDSVGIKRKDVYISNLLKCRPPSNRDPEKGEIEACSSYIERQIKIIQPRIICPLGRYSMQFLMEKFGLKNEIQPIGKTHGKVFKIKTVRPELFLIPFYHPVTVAYNASMKEILKNDFRILEKFKY